MGVLAGALALGLGIVLSGAYRVQVEDHASWRDLAASQRQRRLHVEPKRGTIQDRNGTRLAVSVDVPSVSGDVVEMVRGIEGKEAQDARIRSIAETLGRTLHLDVDELRMRLGIRKRFVWIKRRISSDEAAALKELTDPKKTKTPLRGLTVEGEGRRYYPGREIAGPLLGFVAPDGLGKDGLELSLEEDLHGRVQEVKGLRDRSGRLLFAEGNTEQTSLSGNDIEISIDEGLQHTAERELEAAQRTYETKGASLVAIDPHTGEILAMASTPGFNPNDYSESEPDARRNRAIVDRFEPGSVMKMFTVAAALAAGSLNPTEPIYCEHGIYEVGGAKIHDTHNNDWLTPTQILAKSSNIGALKIALNLGEPALYATFRRFGFGEPTGLPLPGEASGVLRPKGRPWYEVETANASFGQGITVTTMQLALAVGAIANGGKLMEPLLIRRVSDARGNVVREYAPRMRRQVINPGVARLVSEMLTAVVEEGGTGVEAHLAGYRVAGKTSTAQKVDPQTGRYSEEKYTASFVGFVPAEAPRLVVAVVLDEPMVGRYGGDLAGPVFRRVSEAALRYLGVMPRGATARLSNVRTDDDPARDAARAYAASKPEPLPPPPAPLPAGPPAPNQIRVPDAQGLSAREAARIVVGAGLLPHIEGTGRLIKQTPAAGSPVPKGSTVRLVFETSA